MHLLHNMHGKEFTINRKSAIKKDKATLSLELAEQKMFEIDQRILLLKEQKATYQKRIRSYKHTILKNT